MKLESIKGVVTARLVLDDLDAQLLKDRDKQKLIERAIGKLSAVIDPSLIEGPVVDVMGDVLEIGFVISQYEKKRPGSRE